MPRRRIAVIGPSDAIVEPFTGGLAAHVWALTTALQARGHDTTLFAAAGSDPSLPTVDLSFGPPVLSQAARRDVSMPSETFLAEHHAYLTLMLRLARNPERWDVLHNHSLHYLPIAMARSVNVPMVTTPAHPADTVARVGVPGGTAATGPIRRGQRAHRSPVGTAARAGSRDPQRRRL